MSNIQVVNVPDLPSASGFNDPDYFIIYQAGVAKKVPFSVLNSVLESEGGGNAGTSVVVSGSTQISLAAGTYLDKIIVIGTASSPVNVGLTDNGGEIIDDTIGFDGQLTYPLIDQYFSSAQTIYINGTFTIKIISWLI